MPTPPHMLLLAVCGLLIADNARADDGRSVYILKCASCHGADGKGGTPAGRKLGAKDLTASKLGDRELEKQIVSGAKDSNGKAKMPSFKDKLSSVEIKTVVKYVKSLRR